MLASRPLVAASVIFPTILLFGYLWQKRRQEEASSNSEHSLISELNQLSTSPSNNSSIPPIDSWEVTQKLESLTRSRLDCIEEERCETEAATDNYKPIENSPAAQPSKGEEIIEVVKSQVESEKLILNFTDFVQVEESQEIVEELVINNTFAESVAVIAEAYGDKSIVQFSEVNHIVEDTLIMTTEENVECVNQDAIPDALAALKDPIVSPLSSSTPATPPVEDNDDKVIDNTSGDDQSLSSPVKSEVSQKSEALSWCDLIEADEELELEECRRQNNNNNTSLKTASITSATAVADKGRNDSGVASPTEEFSRPETVAAVEEKARISSGEDAGIGGSETDDVSDGNADLPTEDSQLFSYHFYIQDYLTGQFIGSKGTSINKLKTSCGCNVIVRDDIVQNQRRGKLKSRDRRHGNYGEPNMNLVMLEGTRNNIDKCLDSIRERFHNYPELTLEQINKPENTSLSLNAGSVSLSLVEGIMHDVVISSIVYGDHIFIQQPTNPTFSALERLDTCMYNTYSGLACPSLAKPVSPNSICVAPSNGAWFRCQVVSYDAVEDTCSIKYVDYGGYDVIPTDQLKQIRTDFLSLPFQAIECRLANIIVPEVDTVSATVLEELVNGQVIQARMLGVDEDNLPMVHIYRNSNGQTVMVNRELVDRNCAEWIESKFVALPDTPLAQNWNILGDFSPSTDIGNYRMMQVKYFTNLPCNNINTTTSNNFFSSEETGFILSALPPPVNCSPREPPCATLNAPLSPSDLSLYTLDDVFLPVSPFILPETPISLPRTPPHFCTQTTLPTTILLDYQQMQPTTSQFCAVPSPEFTALSPMAITTDFNFISAVNEDGACLSLPELAPSPQPCRLSEDVGGDDDFDQRAVSESPPVTVMC